MIIQIDDYLLERMLKCVISNRSESLVVSSDRGSINIDSSSLDRAMNILKYPNGRISTREASTDNSVRIGSLPMYGSRISNINAEDMPNKGRGYSLNGGSSGNLLTSNTYDGGNAILTGGSNAYRSNYGDSRLPGTIYGEEDDFEYSLNDNEDESSNEYVEEDLYGGNDADYDYANGTISGVTPTIMFRNAGSNETYRNNVSNAFSNGGTVDTFTNAASNAGIGYGDMTSIGSGNGYTRR